MEKLSQLIERMYLQIGIGDATAIIFKDISIAIIVLLISIIAFYIAKNILLKMLRVLTKKTKSKWDDELYDKRVFHKLSYLVPAYILQLLLPIILVNYPHWSSFIESAIHLFETCSKI